MQNFFDLYIEISTKAFPILLIMSIAIYFTSKYLILQKTKKQD